MLSFSQKHFIRDESPFYLYGAEFHYFRSDPEAWSDRLNTIQRAGFNTVSTYIPWIWHAPSNGQADFTGQTHPRRNLVAFLQMISETRFSMIVRPGPYVMSELKNEGIPEWVLKEHPEAIARTCEGTLHPTRVMSYLHPAYLRAVSTWYEQVLAVLRPFTSRHGGPIDMVQLDNEIGMLHWVTNQSDFGESVKADFKAYVQSHFPETERLAEMVGGQFSSHAHFVEAFWDAANPWGLRGHWLWSAFCRTQNARYVSELMRFADLYDLGVPYMINVHGFKDYSIYSRGVDYPIGLSQLQEAAQQPNCLLAGDFYPGKIGYDNFHDVILSTVLTESVSPTDQPVFSAEFQSGRLADRPRVTAGDLDLITRLCVAHGMNGLNYYMFCGGDNPSEIALFGEVHDWQAPVGPKGELRPSYAVAKRLGQLLNFSGRVLCTAPTVVDTHIGFYTPYYATESVRWEEKDTARVLGRIQQERELYHFDGMWRMLTSANIAYRAVDLASCVRIDPLRVPTLWLASTQWMDGRTQDLLVRYVEEGGALILMSQVPDRDLNDEVCTRLADALGVRHQVGRQGFLRVRFEEPVLGHSVFCHQVMVYPDLPEQARCLAVTDSVESEVVAFDRDLGLGHVMVCGVSLVDEYHYMKTLIIGLAKRIGVERSLVPDNPVIHATTRKSQEGSFVSVINADDQEHEVRLSSPTGLLFDGHAVRLPARSGVLLPVSLQVGADVLVRYSTVEIVDVEVAGDEIRMVFASAPGEGKVCLQGHWRAELEGADLAVCHNGGDTVILLGGNGADTERQLICRKIESFRLVEEVSPM